MNDTTFSCSHFLSAGKQSGMSKRFQESSSLGSTTVKARACCLVSRESVSVGQNHSSNPKSLGRTRDTQVRTWEENTKSGWYSVQHASGNREYGHGSEDSGGLSETHASGTREYTRKVVQIMKDRLRHDESSSDISMNSEKMHISIWTIFMASSMQAALHMDPSYEKNLELYKSSEFERIKGFFGITRMMIEGKTVIENVVPADVASSLWERPVLLKEQAIKWTNPRVYVYSDSVLRLGKMHDPEDAIKKVE